MDMLPVGQAVDLGSISLSMSTSFLGELTERITGILTLSIWQGETKIFEERGSISILAFNEWSGLAILPEMTAAFVTPNHPVISEYSSNCS